VGKRKALPVNPQLLQAIGSTTSWSDAVITGDTVWVTGQLGWDKTTGQLASGIEAQTEKTLENLKGVLERAGFSMEDVVLTRVYLIDHEDYPKYDAIYQRYFPMDPPARVSVVVAGLIHYARIDIEAVAVRS
jgi:2-iminobutanoate/2-iminopropanoate deaminase